MFRFIRKKHCLDRSCYFFLINNESETFNLALYTFFFKKELTALLDIKNRREHIFVS